jgi:hypothetical protein
VRRAALLLLVLLACARQKRINLRPQRSFDERGVAFMPFVASEVERFVRPDGSLCARVHREPLESLVGWRSPSDSPACIYDTMDEGLQPAVLQFQWRSELPLDGHYDLVTLEYPIGAWGRVVSRGSYYGDYFAKAQLTVNARAASCAASWALQLAKAEVTGPWSRVAEFRGWTKIPDLVIPNCKANETLEVTLRLQGEANRGRVDVDWFGFSAVSHEDMNRVFGLRSRPSATSAVELDRISGEAAYKKNGMAEKTILRQ